MYIGATDNHDVERFVNYEVERAISCHRILHGASVSESLKTDIISTLTGGAQGMQVEMSSCLLRLLLTNSRRFRWVSLQLQALCNPRIRTAKSLRKWLTSLPSNLEASYDVVYEQIKELRDETRTIAQNTIRWLLCSKQQLQSSELIAAVYMSLDRELLDDEDYDSITADGLLDFCCNLVVLDKSLDTFRMAHFSVRGYFEKVTG